MKIGYLIGSILVGLFSLGYIAIVTLSLVRGEYVGSLNGILSGSFIVGVIIHVLTALLASWLATKAFPKEEMQMQPEGGE